MMKLTKDPIIIRVIKAFKLNIIFISFKTENSFSFNKRNNT